MSDQGGGTFSIAPPLGFLDGSAVVSAVVDAIFRAIDAGELQPGQRLSDARFAEQLGVSRTPVREAFQRLREIGLIEASANRFTRIALITPKQTADTLIVWMALFDALIDEVIPSAPRTLFETMSGLHEQFKAEVAAKDARRTAAANVAFFQAPTALSQNPPLQYGLMASVYIVRLGGMMLAGPINFAQIVEAQRLMLDAIRLRDAKTAHESIAVLRRLNVPGV
jgi:DNA-binding GntR family transcriptional regulator